jgi:hypothetical protein
MNRSILGRAALTVAVVLGLGYGVQEAVASEALRPYCSDALHCQQICQSTYGPDAEGFCSSGNTCYCYY